MKKSTLLMFAVLAICSFIACNDAAQETTTTSNSTTENARDETVVAEQPRGDSNSKEEDAEFMAKAASGGMMEVELGKLAQQKAKNQRVKNFGAMIVKDHTEANTALKALAANKNVPISASMNEEHQKHVTDLREKAGDDFDKDYMSMMVDDHQKDVSDFEGVSNKANDTDLKMFAAKTLPVLRAHLDSAKAIHDAMKK